MKLIYVSSDRSAVTMTLLYDYGNYDTWYYATGYQGDNQDDRNNVGRKNPWRRTTTDRVKGFSEINKDNRGRERISTRSTRFDHRTQGCNLVHCGLALMEGPLWTFRKREMLVAMLRVE